MTHVTGNERYVKVMQTNDFDQGRSQKFVLGRYKTLIVMFNYRFDVILSHKKFTGTDFGRIYILYITPVATPLILINLMSYDV